MSLEGKLAFHRKAGPLLVVSALSPVPAVFDRDLVAE